MGAHTHNQYLQLIAFCSTQINAELIENVQSVKKNKNNRLNDKARTIINYKNEDEVERMRYIQYTYYSLWLMNGKIHTTNKTETEKKVRFENG